MRAVSCCPPGRQKSLPLAASHTGTPQQYRLRPAQGPCLLPHAPMGHLRRASTDLSRCQANPSENVSTNGEAGPVTDSTSKPSGKVAGASTDLRIIYDRLAQLALPYWTDPVVGSKARWSLAGVVGLTLATTGVSVVFNFLGRDFFNALSEKNEELFGLQLMKYLGAFVIGIPVFVFKGYYQSKLALEWRAWLTEKLMDDYFAGRTFYSLQAQSTVDNPDQRISSDAAAFTGTALNLCLVLLNAGIDLVSFSGILYSIYPPLFAALIAYSVSGTLISIGVGKPLVGLNFAQEAREADLRYGLVRVRENAEAVAFYRGEEDEKTLLTARLQAAVSNYLGLLVATRNLDFFTSFYRYMIQLLPAAVVAPLFFQGKIEFGVINQSQSAFNHVLNDMSLVVYQFESLAGFSAVIDRLGQFQEVMGTAKQQPVVEVVAGAAPSSDSGNGQTASTTDFTGVKVQYVLPDASQAHAGAHLPTGLPGGVLLQLTALSVVTPDLNSLLVRDLHLDLHPGESVLLQGPSGAGKTSILRTLAGLWAQGQGYVRIGCSPSQVMFLPQRPYMVLGSLRDQVLYPTYAVAADKATEAVIAAESGEEAPPSPSASTLAAAPASASADAQTSKLPPPSDDEIIKVLRLVRLGHLLSRYATPKAGALDAQVDWSSSLSLGEQQRVAWARLLLAKPRLALLDESSSALDQTTEEELYQLLSESDITYVSVGHRSTLKRFHTQLLQLAPTQTGPDVVDASDKVAVQQQSRANNTWELLPVPRA